MGLHLLIADPRRIYCKGLRDIFSKDPLIASIEEAATAKEKIIMTNPLTGTAGKPIVGVPGPHQTFVGRIIIELFEVSQMAVHANGQIATDANSMALIVSPALDSNVTKEELLQRVAAAFPARAANEIKREERKRKIAEERGGVYE